MVANAFACTGPYAILILLGIKRVTAERFKARNKIDVAVAVAKERGVRPEHVL